MRKKDASSKADLNAARKRLGQKMPKALRRGFRKPSGAGSESEAQALSERLGVEWDE